jgi:RNA methyltransferase, TrmH family
MTITSTHNEKLTQIRKLQQRRRWRERAGRFVAEGEDLLAAADAAGWPALERYCVARSGLAGVEVEPAVLASVSELGSGTRALGVYEERWALQPIGPLCVYLHGVSDPGNVGTVLRSALAFGASSVALGPGSADPFGPKAVRASMGAVFAVPLARAPALTDLPGTTIALVAGAGIPLAELWRLRSEGWTPNAEVEGDGVGGGRDADTAGVGAGGVAASSEGAGTGGASAGGAGTGSARAGAGRITGGITLLIGAERDGLPEELVAGADHVAQIPIRSHSLNAAMAATVALYEVTRMAPE